MFSTDDTIVAISTPPGRGGIGIVRLSGASALEISQALLSVTEPLRPRHATFGRVKMDQVIATYFPAPRSYTGEDCVEISAHGSPVVLRQILTSTIDAGARLAEPGEFTLRAFLHGRVDLIQAEAVADLIDAVTPLQARVAFDQLEGTLTDRIAEIDGELFDLIARLEASLDFPDEGYHFLDPGAAIDSLRGQALKIDALLADAQRGRLIREGAQVVIAGKPNVGKSSLFNALLQTGRAIVTPIPGTTRDLVTDVCDVEGLRVQLVDTAGIRHTADEIEQEGVARARRSWGVADLVLLVLDVSRPLEPIDLELLRETGAPMLVVFNKIDLPALWTARDLDLPPPVKASARRAKDGASDVPPSKAGARQTTVAISLATGDGLDALRCQVKAALEADSGDTLRDCAAITNIRHVELLRRTRAAMGRAMESMGDARGPIPEEFVLTDLQEAREALEEVTGKRTSEDLLRHIFSRFCIGK